jgi:hypothetical protein
MWRFILFEGIYGFLVGFLCAQMVHAIRSRDRIGWSPLIDYRPKGRFVWLESRPAKLVVLVVSIGLVAVGWYKHHANDWSGGVFLLATALTYWLCIKRRAIRF